MPRHSDLPGLRWKQVEPEGLADRSLAPFDRGHRGAAARLLKAAQPLTG